MAKDVRGLITQNLLTLVGIRNRFSVGNIIIMLGLKAKQPLPTRNCLLGIFDGE